MYWIHRAEVDFWLGIWYHADAAGRQRPRRAEPLKNSFEGRLASVPGSDGFLWRRHHYHEI